MNQITYKKIDGYKFQLKEIYHILTKIKLEEDISTPDKFPFIRLGKRGLLSIYNGYAWDGASGPAINNKTIIRGSLVHDALYQLIRSGKLNKSHRKYADEIFRDICLEDGMSKIRAYWVYWAVRLFAGFAVKEGSGKESKIYKAP